MNQVELVHIKVIAPNGQRTGSTPKYPKSQNTQGQNTQAQNTQCPKIPKIETTIPIK